MKVKQLRSKDTVELNKELLEIKRELFNLKMQKATGQLSKPDQLGKLRKDIARIYTIITQKGGGK